MRLTLRTLLAYLDDRLTPTNARELGQKLAKSPFAMELAQRIKDVVRRRRLASDAAQQKLIDPNLVAEYLDDQLTPELISLLEKEVLSSDYSLAEVAATHQILGLLNDPVEIEPSLRERLGQLDPMVKQADDNHVATGTPVAGHEQWTPLQRPTDSQKRSPMILLAVMVLGWLVLLATDSHLFDSAEEPVELADAADTDRDEIDEDIAAVDPDSDVSAPDLVAADAVDAAGAGDSSTADSQPNGNEVDAAGQPVVVVETTQPTGDAGASDGNTAVPVVPETPMVAVPADPSEGADEVVPAVAASTIELTENAGVVFLDDPEQGWTRASTLALDPGQNWIQPLSDHFAVVGPPFSARLISPDGGWAMRVQGPSVLRISNREPLTVQVLEGRFLLQRFGDPDQVGAFHLETGRATLELPVPAAMTAIAVEVVPLPVLPADEVAEAESSLMPLDNHCQISVSAMEADTLVTPTSVTEGFPIPAGSTWKWTTDATATVQNASLENVIPDWALSAATAPTAIQNQLVASSRAALNAGGSIIGSLQAMAGSRNPRIAAFAVQHLTLMREVDNLVALLMTSEQEPPARQESIVGLNRIAALSPAGPAAIRKALATRLPEMDLDDAMKLILGVSRVAAEDATTSAWLVSMLEHSRGSFRELAIFNLERLTGERYGFFAMDETSRRDAAVRRWQRFLERNDGRILQPPK